VTTKRLATSLRMQLREYRSRYLPLVMIALLPLVFWAGTYFTLPTGDSPVDPALLEAFTDPLGGSLVDAPVQERDTWPIDTAFMGVGWALAVAGLFSVIGSGARDRRLVLAGYRAWQILVARFLLLLLIALPVSLIPLFIVGGFSSFDPPNLGLVWLGSYLGGVVGAGIGLIIGSLLPRQLEGTILIIGLIGLEVTIPFSVAFRQFMPLYGPQAIFMGGRFTEDPDVAVHVLRAVVWALVLSGIAVAIWTWRTRVLEPAAAGEHPPERTSPEEPAGR
jgi:hypothetical protein